MDAADQNLLATWISDAARHPPDATAWARLIASLRWVCLQEQRRQADPQMPQGLTASAAAVSAVLEFLQAHPFAVQEGLGVPFWRLQMAFLDIARGRQAPLFKSVASASSRKSATQAVVSALASRAVDELKDDGVSLPAAFTQVARAIRVGKLAGYSKTTSRTVQDWRARLKEGEGSVTAEALSHYKSSLPPEAGGSPKLRAAFLLRVLRNSPALQHG